MRKWNVPAEYSLWPSAALGLCLILTVGACSQVRYVLGFGTGEEESQKDKLEVIDRPDPNEYILVKNPRFSEAGGGPSGGGGNEPEYIWVKRRDVPFTADAMVRGRRAVEAPPAEEARFASTRPPEAARAPRPDERFFLPPDQIRKAPRKAPDPPPQAVARPADPGAVLRPAYGYVVLVKGKQVYTDLSAQNDVAVGSTVIIFREGEELKHPVTGASLGHADEEVGRARILEVGEQTSIAELFTVKEGEEVRAKDRVKLLRAN